MKALVNYGRQITMLDLFGFVIFGLFFVPVFWWLGWPGFVAFNAGGLGVSAARILREDKQAA